ncbi:MAG: hypothetical protein HOH19_00170 [Kordiimonadaceae bacterium]|jgi:hypothetical protein|nr:hypothetical protein [Kordiimonadaceae bacterium]MBT6030964.1 hypothetical protein [Kordiimonadaceae bacterium]
MIDITLFDIIGMVGVGMIITTYGLLQTNRMNVKSMGYSIYNSLGAALILVSLWADFNLSAFVIEAFWFIFSMVGLYSALKKKSE